MKTGAIALPKPLRSAPDSVTIYEMEIPYNTTIYKQMKSGGKLVAPVADWEPNRGWVTYAFAELEEADYHVASAYTAVKNKSAGHICLSRSIVGGGGFALAGRRFLRAH